MTQTSHQLMRDSLGRLVFVDAKGHSHVGVHPVRAFPVTASQFIWMKSSQVLINLN